MIGLILIVILSIVALMVIHEFGHFIVAKIFKVEVEEFGVGLPPRLFGKKFGNTLYSINLIPFGAFVKIPSMENDEEGKNIGKVPVWKRFLIVLAGVVSFWIIAVILLTIVFNMGSLQSIQDDDVGPFLSDPEVQILSVVAGSPADIAGLQYEDAIKAFKLKNQEEFQSIDKIKEMQDLILQNGGKEITLKIKRGVEEFEVTLVPRVFYPEEEGSMGVSLIRLADKSYSLGKSFISAVDYTVFLTKLVCLGFYKLLASLFSGKGLPEGMEFMGIVGLGSTMVQVAKLGVNYYLNFIALISVYLAVFNLLPIPALDGGRLLFLIIEKIKGSPIKPKVEQIIVTVFFVLLIMLMIFVTIQDVINLF